MYDKLVGEVFILGLQIIICIRVFFVQQKSIVSSVILSPISVVISILHFCIWGLTLPDLIIFVITLLIFFGNIHALLRFFHHLYIDYYTIAFVIFSIFMTVICACCVALLVYLRPAYSTKTHFHTEVTKTPMIGSFSDGYTPRAIFDPLPTATIWTIKPNTQQQTDAKVVIFVPDVRSNVQRYLPILQELANHGLTVISADLPEITAGWFDSSLDFPLLRPESIFFQSLYESNDFDVRLRARTNKIEEAYDTLIAYADSLYGKNTTYFLLSDTGTAPALTFVAPKYPYKIAGVYSLHYDTDYRTAGYGCVDSSDPVYAWILGLRKFDQDMFIARYIAIKTSNKIEAAFRQTQGVHNDAQ